MPTQLRVYTINRGSLETFSQEFRDKIKPLREKLGFQIDGAWTITATNQFVWLMRYDGPQDWETLDQSFHTSQEHKAMQPDPARNIARMENYFLDPVE